MSTSPEPAASSASAPPATPRTIACPFCRAAAAELISLFGSQLLLSQYRCARCGSYFEAVRGEADGS
jgi:hypothetical protein